jgi:hypothetical protein
MVDSAYKDEWFTHHQMRATVKDLRMTKYRPEVQTFLCGLVGPPPRGIKRDDHVAPQDPRALPDDRGKSDPALSWVYTAEEAARIYSAYTVLAVLREQVSFSSVLEVGCGRGIWLAVASRMGASRVVGLERRWALVKDPYCDPAWIQSCDLENRLDLGERFDLVLSLEVAQRLNPSSAARFVTSLTRHGDLILFSAAIPHQGGVGHINEQFADYWAQLFAKAGFSPLDIIRRRIWNVQGIRLSFRQNILLYVSMKYLSNNQWARDALLASGPISAIHPQTYLQRCLEGGQAHS